MPGSWDNMVIEAALAGEARWGVTGDKDLLSLGTYETVSFVTPRSFQERLDAEVSGLTAMMCLPAGRDGDRCVSSRSWTSRLFLAG